MFQGGSHDSKSALLAIVSHADPSGTSRGDSTGIKFRCYQQGRSGTPRIHSAIRRGATESRRRDRRAVLGCRICLRQSGRRTRVARRANRKPARDSDFLRFAHPRARRGSRSRLPGREHGGLYGSTENRRSLQWSSRARRVSRAGCLDPPRRPLAKARKPTDPDTQVKGPNLGRTFLQTANLTDATMELQFLGQWFGVLIAVVSSSLGGTAAAVTLYLVGNADPITVAILRWGIGLLCLLPTALFLGVRWPPRRDWAPIVALGLCLFGIFFVLYNIAVSYTTAARASLALSTLPLQTMVVGALLGIEPLTKRKTVGVCVAVLGVFAALASGLSAAPSGAWRGELIMTGAGLCMAFYNVWSRPFSQRSSALGFLTVGMGAGAVMLVAVGSMTGSITVLST